MGRIFTHMTMSLDGFIADARDGVGELFEWYEAGDVGIESANPDVSFHVDEASAQVVGGWTSGVGALITGRRLFDITRGWGDRHPIGAPVVVVTHQPPADVTSWPRTTFAGDVPSALDRARAIAGDRDVVIASADVAQQALELGLVDEVVVSLVPVLFGEGKRYFGALTRGHVLLEDPEVIAGRRAVHLRYRVRR